LAQLVKMSETSNPEFEKSLAELEESLKRLKERYQQIQHMQQEQAKLLKKLPEIEPNLEMVQQVESMRDELQILEVNLESGLLKDDELRHLFWQAVKNGLLGDVFWQTLRFGGIGLILGWLLRYYTAK